jgi:hypothetical protein
MTGHRNPFPVQEHGRWHSPSRRLDAGVGSLRYEPSEERIRGTLGEEIVIDSRRAMLVWEPRRVVPTYAVPVEDVVGEINAAPLGDSAEPRPAGIAAMGAPRLGDRVVFDPTIPFSVHRRG